MRYRFTRMFARVAIAFGVVTMVAGMVLPVVALYFLPWHSFWGQPASATVGYQDLAAAGVLAVCGLVIGATTIAVGQLVLAFFDIRAQLGRIDRRLRDREKPPEAAATERSRRRRL